MKSIFEIANEKFSIKENISQIKNAFEKNKVIKEHSMLDILDSPKYDMTFEEYIGKNDFGKWEYKAYSLSILDYKKKLNIDNISVDSDEDQMIHYLEYVYNMLKIFDKDCYYNEMLLNNICDLIEKLLSKINYRIIKIDSEKYKVIVNNESLPAVINNVSENVKIYFVEYLFVDNTIKEKKSALKYIADYFEGLKKEYCNSKVDFTRKIYNDTMYYFNNYDIRHNNREGKNKKEKLIKMPNEKLKHIYDMIYNNCLLLVLLKKYEPFNVETEQNKLDIPS